MVVCPNDTLCYLKSDMKLLNGMVYCSYGDMGLFKNGLKNGLHKEWSGNGLLFFKGFFLLL